MYKQKRKSFPMLEHEIREAIKAIKAADTDTDAAKAFRALETSIGEYLPRCAEMQQQFYRQRAALARQAAQIEDLHLERVIGPRRTHEPTQPILLPQPEVITVQQAPQAHFVRLSFGFVALQHIITLDVKAKMLYTAQGTQSLSADDVRALIPQMKMHLLKPIASISKIREQHQPQPKSSTK
jgi:hypothetical protein